MSDGYSHHVLRFSNTVWNDGEGRLELQGDPRPDGSSKVYQNVYDSPTAGTRVSQRHVSSDLINNRAIITTTSRASPRTSCSSGIPPAPTGPRRRRARRPAFASWIPVASHRAGRRLESTGAVTTCSRESPSAGAICTRVPCRSSGSTSVRAGSPTVTTPSNRLPIPKTNSPRAGQQ